MMYSDIVIDHFTYPRNVGVIMDPDGVGEVGNAASGEMMRIYLAIEGDIIKDIRFKTFGCGAAVAASSMVTEMAKGKTIDEALLISDEAVAEALGGLPPEKIHCSYSAADALHKAIRNYLEKQQKKE